MKPPVPQVQRALDQLNAGRPDQAEAALRRHLQKSPGDATANHVMAAVLLRAGKPDQALYYSTKASAMEPDNGIVLGMHATALSANHRLAEAEPVYRRARALAPNDLGIMNGLGAALLGLHRADEAAELFRACRDRAPTHRGYAENLVLALSRAWRHREALEAVDDALKRWPGQHHLLLHRAGMLNYDADASPEAIYQAHLALARSIEAATGSAPRPRFDPDPARPIRVGLLSADFRQHSVAHFASPLLRAFGPGSIDGITLVALSAVDAPDITTERLRATGVEWRDVHALEGQPLADAIRTLGIDVLLDLGGYTHGSRVDVLARRPAPVQGTWLGYPNTTGLAACDFRLVDSATDPPGAEAFARERLVRLDPCFLCYDPPPESPPESSLAVRQDDATIFASFNALLKVTDATLDLWARVLAEVPRSRLVLKDRLLSQSSVRERLLSALEHRGLARERVRVLDHVPSLADHLALYREIDVALDPFPYHGTTTTCDALWMGVPVVTLAGRMHAGRVGVSILRAAGLDHLVADTPERYASIAASLAGNPAQLAAWRTTLRDRVRASPLGDADAFARRFARAIREAWGVACHRAGGNA